MSVITTRSGKGSALTSAEVDANFTNLNSDKAEKSITISAGTGLTGGGDLSGNRTLALGNSGVSAGTFGGNNSIPTLTIDAFGRVTAAGTVTPSGTWGISISGNAATVTDGVYLSGTQTISGNKTFSGVVGFSNTITGSITGNAGTVTNGVYASGDQTIAGNKTFSGITSVAALVATAQGGAEGGEINLAKPVSGTNFGGNVILDVVGTSARLFADVSGTTKVFEFNFGGAAGTVLSSGNYNSYAPTLTGGGASGTWGISITGNSATASALTAGGKTVQGNLVVQGDISAYRAGGTTGVIYFSTSGTRYLYWDGDNYYMPGGNLHVASGNPVLHSGNYSAYSTFSGAVTSGGNTGFKNDTFYVGVRNPIWNFANSTAFGISYFQGTAGIADNDTIGLHPNGTATAAGSAFAVNAINAYVRGHVVLNASNYNSYALPLSGGIVSGAGRFRKAQSAGDYTTAPIWTESFDNTTTGIAFHISNVVGRFLEMRTNGILYWGGDTVLSSGNYGTYALPLSGGTMSGDLQMSGSFLRFNESGVRSWSIRSTGGSLDLLSGDNLGSVRVFPKIRSHGLADVIVRRMGVTNVNGAQTQSYSNVYRPLNAGWRHVASIPADNETAPGNGGRYIDILTNLNSDSAMCLFWANGYLYNNAFIDAIHGVYLYTGNQLINKHTSSRTAGQTFYNSYRTSAGFLALKIDTGANQYTAGMIDLYFKDFDNAWIDTIEVTSVAKNNSTGNYY